MKKQKIEAGAKIYHKWRKGGLPQLCLRCGILRSRKTFKIRMAITNYPPYDHYKYESKMVYTDINGTLLKRPNCNNSISKADFKQ